MPTHSPDGDRDRGRKLPTQRTIAALAGVSQETVSHILSGNTKKSYSAATTENVRRIASELGYVPDRGSRAMRKGRSNLMLALNFGGYSKVAAERIYHLGRFAHEEGYDFQSIDAYWWVNQAQKIIDQVKGLKPEGIIVSGVLQTPFSPAHLQELARSGFPVVTLGLQIEGLPGVQHDVAGATRELASHALQSGRRRLALPLGNTQEGARSWQATKRIRGFTQAMQQAGITPLSLGLSDFYLQPPGTRPQAYIINTFTDADAHLSFELATHPAVKLVHTPTPPDAIIHPNDNLALRTLCECHRRGFRVPGEMWISGFDNLPYGTLSVPPLTSVEQPTEAMCAEVIRMLKAVARTPNPLTDQPAKRVLPCKIVWRESTGHRSNHTTPSTLHHSLSPDFL